MRAAWTLHRDCPVKGKGKSTGKSFGKSPNFQKGAWQPSQNWQGTGVAPTPRACFACGGLDQVIANCPRTRQVQAVQATQNLDGVAQEVLFIGNVKSAFQQPRKCARSRPFQDKNSCVVKRNRFAALAALEDDSGDARRFARWKALISKVTQWCAD